MSINLLKNIIETKKYIVLKKLQSIDPFNFMTHNDLYGTTTKCIMEFHFQISKDEINKGLILKINKFIKINIDNVSKESFELNFTTYTINKFKVKELKNTIGMPYKYDNGDNIIKIKIKINICNDKMSINIFINLTEYNIKFSCNPQFIINSSHHKDFAVPNKSHAIMSKSIKAQILNIVGNGNKNNFINDDVQIIMVNNKKYYVHNHLLKKYEFFNNLISKKYVDNNNKFIKLKEISNANFNKIINYFYTTNIIVTSLIELEEILY